MGEWTWSKAKTCFLDGVMVGVAAAVAEPEQVGAADEWTLHLAKLLARYTAPHMDKALASGTHQLAQMWSSQTMATTSTVHSRSQMPRAQQNSTAKEQPRHLWCPRHNLHQ